MLTERDRTVIGAALRAAADGPFFPDWEFQTLMGLDRDEMRAASARWRTDATDEGIKLAVNNALNMLLGYPHGAWDAWPRFSDATPKELEQVFERWRAHVQRREAP